MIGKIALVGAATLFSVSIAVAQNSAPSSTAGGAQGTSKGSQSEQPAGKAARTGTTGAVQKGQSSPESTAGGAVGTSKDPRQKN